MSVSIRIDTMLYKRPLLKIMGGFIEGCVKQCISDSMEIYSRERVYTMRGTYIINMISFTIGFHIIHFSNEWIIIINDLLEMSDIISITVNAQILLKNDNVLEMLERFIGYHINIINIQCSSNLWNNNEIYVGG